MGQKIYGISNTAYYNIRAAGDVTFYPSKAERDAALESLRDEAIGHGLSKSASVGGILPVAIGADDIDEGYEGDLGEWLRRYDEYDSRPGERARMLDEVGL